MIKRIKRIGVHVGTSGGAVAAIDRANEFGANTLQIFSASPRMWRAPKVDPEQAQAMRNRRVALDVAPLIIHTSYLINVCAQSDEIRQKSIVAFRAEIERALLYGASGLVLHPGSWKGLTRDEGLRLAADSIAQAIGDLAWQGTKFEILIENTAGAEFSLGGSLDQVAELVARLKPTTPVAVCLDTCHTHVAGYDLVSADGYEVTVAKVAATVGLEAVKVWHCNDAKAACGSKLDRHEHIGLGTIGIEPFRRLLNDERFAHSVFIAETPVDDKGDEAQNVRVLKSLIR